MRSSEDWDIGHDGVTLASAHSHMQKWLTGPKSPGLIVLEHELTDDTVNTFINALPVKQGR